MASQSTNLEDVADFLLSKVDIQVSGACSVSRTQPIECYYPFHRPYSAHGSKKHAPIDTCMEAIVPGGVPRPVESAVAKDGYALVYDRDIEKVFENALGQETVLIVLEAFMDEYPDILDDNAQDVLHRFHEFIDGLGTQMLTITVTSIVRDMIESYGSIRDTLTAFYTFENPNLFEALKEFVLTRECWHYPRKQEPALEVTFSVTRFRSARARGTGGRDMVLNLHYSSNPPTLGFHGLQNVVGESKEFILKPTVRSARPFSELSMVDVDYFVGPSRDWLEWDPANTCFRGRVPPGIASVAGVQRQDAYTMLLEITASITKVFPGGIRYENVTRCALPLTVKRRPDDCGPCYGLAGVPSPMKSLFSIPGLVLPPPMNVEVRMMRDFTLHGETDQHAPGPSTSKRPTTPRVPRTRGKAKIPLGPKEPNVGDEPREMGSTHVDKCGDLASDSDSGTPEPTPKAVNIHLSPEHPRTTARSAKRRFSPDDVRSTAPRRKKGIVALPSQPALRNSEDTAMLPEDPVIRSAAEDGPDTVASLRHLHNCVDKVFAKAGAAEWNEFYRHIQRFLPSHFDTPSKLPSTPAERAPTPPPHKFDPKCKVVGENHIDEEFAPRSRSSSHVDSVRRGQTPSPSRDEVEPVNVEQWQREIQRNFEEFKEHKRDFSEGIDTKMADAEAWSESELILPE
ncbi:hypothetical protein TI39_contig69g00009 [Zymoseptoria brevis]|uniref:Uncharacterized protein n=1 Tax=Zymoseptoria brevis TaxID=1047168 RepID=A0A0F4GYF0_9PEZI|nr:hypothetical protein TI39_contig69g00009 [Zymoseptoria brevis]